MSEPTTLPAPPAWLPAGPLESSPGTEVYLALGHRVLGQTDAADELRRALDGIPLGAFDRRIVGWLAGWDHDSVVPVLSWLYRTRAAGIASGAAQAAAAERLRLAELLWQMHDRQDAAWEAQPDQDRPRYLYRSWYLDGLHEAAELVERGGADGIAVRVDGPAPRPSTPCDTPHNPQPDPQGPVPVTEYEDATVAATCLRAWARSLAAAGQRPLEPHELANAASDVAGGAALLDRPHPAAGETVPGEGQPWEWMTGYHCLDCDSRSGASRGWSDGAEDPDRWCQEQEHQVVTWYGPDPDADQDAAAAVERWWERFAHAEESARLLAAGTDDAAARWHAGRAAELTAALGDELAYSVRVTTRPVEAT